MASNPKRDEVARANNKAIKSTVFTFYKKAVAKLNESTASMKEVFDAIRQFESVAAKAARKNIVSQRSGARRVSSLIMKAKTRFDQLAKKAA